MKQNKSKISKATRRKTNKLSDKLSRVSKKKLILGSILLAVVLITAWVLFKNYTYQNQLRVDREKFTQLEAKMESILVKFKEIAPDANWRYEKSCARTGGKFENATDRKFCNLTVETDQNLSGKYNELANAVIASGFNLSERRENRDKTMIYREYGNESQEMGCLIGIPSDEVVEDQETFFNCQSKSLQYYYTRLR